MNQSKRLTPEETIRYSRHLAIPEFGAAGQEKLKNAKVLVVGSGGLGSPLLLYLAAAGVGHIGIVDFDVIEESNLQRQVLFGQSQLGLSKAEMAKHRIHDLNKHIQVEVYNTRLTKENALSIISAYDVVADGTDNFPTRYLVNDACVLAGKVNVYASIFRFEGQVSVFNFAFHDGTRGPHYRHMFPEPPPPGLVPSCAEGGVLGVLPGIIGSMQALEVIKVITGVGEPLAGRIFLFDGASFSTRILEVPKKKEIAIRELIDYEQFCKMHAPPTVSVEELDVTAFQEKIRSGEEMFILDVREPFEWDITNIGAKLIPLSTLTAHLDELPQEKMIIVHCKSGARSTKAVQSLMSMGFRKVYNLKGGIHALADAGFPGASRY